MHLVLFRTKDKKGFITKPFFNLSFTFILAGSGDNNFRRWIIPTMAFIKHGSA